MKFPLKVLKEKLKEINYYLKYVKSFKIDSNIVRDYQKSKAEYEGAIKRLEK